MRQRTSSPPLSCGYSVIRISADVVSVATIICHAAKLGWLLHLMRYRSLSAAAAGGAAAFADVAAACWAHLGAAGEAERCVGDPALMGFDQLGRASRSGGRDSRSVAFRLRLACGLRTGPWPLDGGGLGQLHRVDFVGRRGWVLPG